MDTKLQSQLKSLLSAYCQLEWLSKGNDPRAVLQYIEASGVLSLKSIWKSIEDNLVKIRADAAKDSSISQVALEEATFQLAKLKKLGDKVSDKHKQQKLTGILELTDRALIFCPTSTTARLAQVYALRSSVLLESGQPKQALVAIKEAIQLEPTSPLYHRALAEILYTHLNCLKEALKHIRTAISLADYPRTAEEEEDEEGEVASANCLRSESFFSPSFIAELRALETSILEEIMEDEEEECNESPLPPPKQVKNFSMDYRTKIMQQADCKGRLIVSTDSIPSGTAVFREHAYSMVILPEVVFQVCALCARYVTGRLVVPCSDCTEVVYCSASCAQLHRNSGGHQFGCQLMGHLTERSKSTTNVFNMLNRTGVMQVLKAIEESGEWNEGQKKENDVSPYDMMAYSHDTDQRFTAEIQKDETLRRQAYQAQMTLYSHYEKYPVGYLSTTISNAIECAITASIAQGFTYEQLSGDGEDDQANQLVTLIVHCFVAIRRVVTNCFRWSGKDEAGSRVNIAICYHLIGSLFNHACNPNAQWGIDGGVIAVSTIRDVQAGEELTISYGPTKADAFAQRQKRLLTGYYFQCNCSLCIDDCKREEGVLKCTACTGPVLGKPSGKHVAACLACGQPLEGAPEKVLQLERAIIDLEIKTKLMMSAALVAEKKEKKAANKNRLASLRQSLQTIAELIYSPSHRLLESLYKASQVLFEQGNFEECLVFGELVDCWMPVKAARAAELLVISAGGEGKGAEEKSSSWSSLWDINLDHLAFWCTVYRLVIERTGSGSTDQQGHWCILLRFNGRLKRLLKSILLSKESRLAELKIQTTDSEDSQQKKQRKSGGKGAEGGGGGEHSILQQEVHILNQYKEHKAQQLAELQAKFSEIDFGHLEAVSFGS